MVSCYSSPSPSRLREIQKDRDIHVSLSSLPSFLPFFLPFPLSFILSFFFLSFHFSKEYLLLIKPWFRISRCDVPRSSFTSLGEGWRKRREGGASLDLSRKHAFCPVVILGQLTPRIRGRGTCTHACTIRTWRHRRLQRSLPSHSGGSYSSLPTLPGLPLVGEAAVKRIW